MNSFNLSHPEKMSQGCVAKQKCTALQKQVNDLIKAKAGLYSDLEDYRIQEYFIAKNQQLLFK